MSGGKYILYDQNGQHNVAKAKRHKTPGAQRTARGLIRTGVQVKAKANKVEGVNKPMGPNRREGGDSGTKGKTTV